MTSANPTPTKQVLIHGLRLTFAAWFAFCFAVLLHIPNPYWAAMPIWVVAQASRGLTLERGLFRTIGTLIGAAVGLGTLHFFPAVAAQMIILSLWVGISAGLSHLLRGVRAYCAIMMGITASIVVLPSILNPTFAMSLALARIECTLIGVASVTLIIALFTAASPWHAFYANVRNLSAQAIAFAKQTLSENDPTRLAHEEQRLLKELGEVDVSTRLIAAGSREGYRQLDAIDTLISASICVMASAKAIQFFAPLSWNHLDASNPCVQRMLHAIEAIQSIDEPTRSKKLPFLAPPRDWVLARRSGIVSTTVTILAATLGLVSGWAYGELAAVAVCTFSIVLGSLPFPQKIAPHLLKGALVGIAFAIAYRILLQPHLTATLSILFSVLPFLLLGGWVRANPSTAMAAIDANMCFLLGSQAGMPPAPWVQVLSGSAALVIGVVFMTTGHMLWPRQPEEGAKVATSIIRKDLLSLLRSRTPPIATPHRDNQWHARSGRTILQSTSHAQTSTGLLAALSLGHAIIYLQHMVKDQSSPKELKERVKETLQVLEKAIQNPGFAQDAAQLRTDQTEDPKIVQALRHAQIFLFSGK